MPYLALSRRALLDLAEIEQYSTETWGKKVATSYLGEIEDALNRLKENPGLLRSRPELSDHLKFYRVGRHLLVCAQEGENIYVLTLKHGAMDLPERLAEMEPEMAKEAELLHQAFLRSRKV
ncbi:type II toxin-antitoxin system RelE/ParE family toxin [Luteolibacter flavescens]|uniref:Type II toxin-antitoxin system RelE/ParE family toxin n=1 Tax=Luteolibacter flavescens TaxID=1859460 RepID=A0ABT3FT79_9BACT|nr:type II toxin-antitoxin system RelE/ParE family toxin [Luteolibacter flavescens]MCW1886529.1 type II toxin-antitoxin system RelE/ParE family toxin [Luteolibacter flavescens]